MELREYWRIVRRRGWLVVGTTAAALLAAIVSVLALPQPLPSYQATTILGARPLNVPDPRTNPYGDYYLYVASEFLNDDLMAVVESGGFNETLRQRLADRPEGPPSASIKGKKAHRVVTFTVSADRESDARDVAKGIVDLLVEPRAGEPRYLDQFSDQQPRITVIDPPRITVQPGVRRSAFDVGVRTLLGLIVGLGLAFLLHHLDDTLRDRREVERLTGLPVLAEIPTR